MKQSKKGFTLLELLIVIGILAILATTAILVLNPAELLKRSRDSARISDLSTIKSAIGIYLTDVSSPDLAAGNGSARCTGDGTAKWIWVSVPSTGISNCPTSASSTTFVLASSTPASGAVDGTGWIPVNLTNVSTKSPLGSFPLDPTNSCAVANSGKLFYVYACNQTNLTFALMAHMESKYYGYTAGGPTNDVMAKDGGTGSSVYEVGTDLTSTTEGGNGATTVLGGI